MDFKKMPKSIKAPWLSILIPVYNVKPYLEDCIESILKQSNSNLEIEIILLDDCSTDGSKELAEALVTAYSDKIKLLYHTHNQGLSAARNTLLNASSGKYIWFLDSDDFILDNALTKLKSTIETTSPDLVICDFQVWRGPEQTLKHIIRGEQHQHTFQGPSDLLLRNQSMLIEKLCLNGRMHAWSKIFRRDIWQKVDIRFPPGMYFEDLATIPRLLLNINTFIYISEPWIAYRQREGSILSNMTLKKVEDLSKAMEHFSSEFKEVATQNAQLNHKNITFAISHLLMRNYLKALKALEKLQVNNESTTLKKQMLERYLIYSPMSPRELLKAYLKKGWIIRWLKTIKNYK